MYVHVGNSTVAIGSLSAGNYSDRPLFPGRDASWVLYAVSNSVIAVGPAKHTLSLMKRTCRPSQMRTVTVAIIHPLFIKRARHRLRASHRLPP